ncbi:MAG: polymer-forming cytoskeletal protein [FCB group bacterium]|nr:polymer-forming cytoskeletal protein [FCB group bacterium]
MIRKWIYFIPLALFLTHGLADSQYSRGEIVRLGSDIIIEEGQTVKTAVSIGGDVTVLGTVRDEAVSVGGNIHVGPKAVIGGDLVSVGGTLEIEDGAELRGDIVEVGGPFFPSFLFGLGNTGNILSLWLQFRIYTHLGFLIISLILLALFIKPLEKIADRVEETALRAAIWGVVGIILVVPLALMLVVSLIGIILVPLEIFLVICASAFGYIAVSIILGRKIARGMNKPDMTLFMQGLIGLVLLFLLALIPFVGWLILKLVLVIGFGAVLVTVYESRKGNEAKS